MIKCVLPVLEMSCSVCAGNVESIVRNIRGVRLAVVNFATESLTLEYDPAVVSLEKIQAEVQAAGYDIIISDSDRETQQEASTMRQYRRLRQRLMVAWVCAMPLMSLSMWGMDILHVEWVLLLLTLPIMLFSGQDFYVHAWKQLRLRTSNMDTLVALSTLTAFIISFITTLLPDFWTSRDIDANVYYESAGMIIAFVLTGKFLEERAKRHTASALKSLMGLQPHTALKITDGVEQEVAIATLRVGDCLVVRPGEKVPVDGVVVEGEGFIDESMINGEPLPRAKHVGDKVLTGTINKDQILTVEARAVGRDTLLAQIVQRVQEAQGSKAPVQRIVDKVSQIFVPTIITISVITFIAWYISGVIYSDGSVLAHALVTAISVLVIACPCAMGLATPMAIMVAMGRAARDHILIKDAVALEKMCKVNCVVLDKTGTLTEGHPEVKEIYWRSDEIETHRSLLSAVESTSTHPLAQAIKGYIRDVPYINAQSINVKQHIGGGLQFTYEGKIYRVGNARFTRAYCTQGEATQVDRWQQAGITVVYYTCEEDLLALIAITDPLKKCAIEAVSTLQSKGVEVHMLTGDSSVTAQATAIAAGISHVQAEAMPQDKENYVRALQKQGYVVAMVGDGINDSQALAMADVSVAMGQGTDVAIDVAMVTLINSNLTLLSRAIELSRATVRVIRENLFWAFIYNLICIPVAAGVLYPFSGILLDPMWAGAAMAFSSVSVVLNSLRLNHK